MAGGLTSQLISGLVGLLPRTQDLFPSVLDALLGMEKPVCVGRFPPKLTLELGTGGVVWILMRLGMAEGFISQLIGGVVVLLSRTQHVFP